MLIINTRPQPDAVPLTRMLLALGYKVIESPLLKISFDVETVMLDLERAQAILVTSGNGVRALTIATNARNLPLFAVGNATARVAEQLGFTQVTSAEGDVERLAEKVIAFLDPNGGEILHISGTEVAGNIARSLAKVGFVVRRVSLYAVRSVDTLSAEMIAAMRTADAHAVVFFSPRTARTFVRLVRREGLISTCGMLSAYCLSPAVANEIHEFEWLGVHVAKKPNQQSLVDCLLETPPHD